MIQIKQVMITMFKDPYYMNSKTKQILQNQKNQYADKKQYSKFYL